ncbi:MAG: dihydroorotase [Ruminococcaceae bacterium]|nr:dihydroorotase [Oscillospiraceae bacterium]
MNYILRNCNIYRQGKFSKGDLFLKDGIVVSSSDMEDVSDVEIIDCGGAFLFPGLCDVHVHLREPGFLYKETIATGTAASARGGYTAVCSMPNLNPCPDSVENINVQLRAIKNDACINVYPYACITEGEKGEVLTDITALSPLCIGFSDDGKGVQDREMMKNAMIKAKECGKIIAAHCEDNSLLHGGYIHDGEYAKAHGHKGICSESEWKPIARDIELIKETGCAYHVCHISTKESVDIIRKAKAEGVNITCETGPHYLVLDDSDLQENARFKMNPPLRGSEDREALVAGILDGTIDMIATDHAPHSAEEKSRGLEKSLMGVVGIETAVAVMYTNFVKTGKITAERLVELMHTNPRRRFGLPTGGTEIGDRADFTVFDFAEKYKVDPAEFLSMGRSTPFEGEEVYGKCLMTICNGKIAYIANK